MTGLRRILSTLLLALTVLGAGVGLAHAQARPQPIPRVTAADHVLGNPGAPVTVVEYGSMVCPHCAEWQIANFYAFKARFIDTGQVRFVFRDMLTEPAEQAATAAAIARCGAPERYFDVVHQLMLWQGTARNFGPISDWYDKAVVAGGRPPEEVRACVADPATREAINAQMSRGVAAGVTKTPTFFVNGVMTADGSMEALTAAIDAAAAPGR